MRVVVVESTCPNCGDVLELPIQRTVMPYNCYVCGQRIKNVKCKNCGRCYLESLNACLPNPPGCGKDKECDEDYC